MCHLRIKEEKIVSFLIDGEMNVDLKTTLTAVDFSQPSYSLDQIEFFPEGDYRVENKDLAKRIIEESYQRLKEISVLGHGFPVGPFKANGTGMSLSEIVFMDRKLTN